MILLEDNPLDDVGNIQKRAGIMVRGRWFSEDQLRSMLEGLVKFFKPDLIDRLWPLALVVVVIAMIVRTVRRSST